MLFPFVSSKSESESERKKEKEKDFFPKKWENFLNENENEMEKVLEKATKWKREREREREMEMEREKEVCVTNSEITTTESETVNPLTQLVTSNLFDNYQLAGITMVADFKNIQNKELLQNPAEITKLCKNICRKYKFTIVKETEHIFHPQGFTLCFILSESHFIVHTYPEQNFCSLDLYSCRQDEGKHETYENIFDDLLCAFCACENNSSIQVIERCFNKPNTFYY